MRAILLSVLLVSPAAMAQTLWGGTEAGMSLEAVVAAVPGAATVDATKSPKLPSGAQREAALDDVRIDDIRFAASFYFLDSRLQQVVLSSRIPDGQAAGAAASIDRIIEALRTKYGKERSNDMRRSALGFTGSATWTAGRTTVRASVFAFNNSAPTMLIAYSAAQAQLGDKL